MPTSIYSPREEPVKKRPAGPVGSALRAGSSRNPCRSSPPTAPWPLDGVGRFDRLRLLHDKFLKPLSNNILWKTDRLRLGSFQPLAPPSIPVRLCDAPHLLRVGSLPRPGSTSGH